MMSSARSHLVSCFVLGLLIICEMNGRILANVSTPRQDPELANRTAQIQQIASRIQNSMRFHVVDNVVYLLNMGPVPIQGSLAAEILMRESVAIQKHVNPNLKAIGFIGASSNISNANDYQSMYQNLSSLIPVPTSAIKWDDEAFGEDRLTIKAHYLKSIPPKMYKSLNANEDEVKSVCGKTLQKLRQSKLGYVVDLSFASQFNDPDAPQKYAPGVRAFFCSLPGLFNSKFVPFAIHIVDTDIMYYPSDDNNQWQLAKMALNAAEINALQMDHFLETHMYMEPIRVEMFRHVSDKHPVYRILEHHFFQIFANTPLGLQVLLSKGTTYDQTFGWGATGSLRYLRDQVLNSTFIDFESKMKMQGLNQLKGFRYRDYGRKLLQILKRFLRDYLALFYPNPKSLREDQEIQNWAASTSTIMNGFPCEFKTLDALVEAMSNLIFRTAVQHHTLNSNTTWQINSYPYSLPSLNHPLPTTKNLTSPINLLAYNIPRPLLGPALVQIASFHRVLPIELSLQKSYDDLDLGAGSEDIIKAYQKRLAKLQRDIQRRETRQHSDRPFLEMLPESLPYYVWI